MALRSAGFLSLDFKAIKGSCSDDGLAQGLLIAVEGLKELWWTVLRSELGHVKDADCDKSRHGTLFLVGLILVFLNAGGQDPDARLAFGDLVAQFLPFLVAGDTGCVRTLLDDEELIATAVVVKACGKVEIAQ